MKRIHKRYADELLHDSPLLKNLGTWNESLDVIQYKCLTDSCPSGGTCTKLSLRDEGQQFATRMSLFRRFFSKAMRWASEVEGVKSQVPQFVRHYDRNELKLIAALDNLPEHTYVIDVYIPRR